MKGGEKGGGRNIHPNTRNARNRDLESREGGEQRSPWANPMIIFSKIERDQGHNKGKVPTSGTTRKKTLAVNQHGSLLTWGREKSHLPLAEVENS